MLQRYDKGHRNTSKILNDDMSSADFLEFLRAAFQHLFVNLKKGGAVYVAHSETEGINFRAAFELSGLKLSACLVWRKDVLVLGRSDYQWIHEPILYGWKPGASHRWYGGRKQTSVADFGDDSPFIRAHDGQYQITIGDRVLMVDGAATVEEFVPSVLREEKPKRNDLHPTMKPVALIERMLRNSGRPGDVVLEPFGGSGSTLMAAERLSMSARVIELAPAYVDVIVRRWKDYTGKTAVRVSDGVEFDDARTETNTDSSQAYTGQPRAAAT